MLLLNIQCVKIGFTHKLNNTANKYIYLIEVPSLNTKRPVRQASLNIGLP